MTLDLATKMGGFGELPGMARTRSPDEPTDRENECSRRAQLRSHSDDRLRDIRGLVDPAHRFGSCGLLLLARLLAGQCIDNVFVKLFV